MVKPRCETFFDLCRNFPMGKSSSISATFIDELHAIYGSVEAKPYPRQAVPVRDHLLNAMAKTLHTIEALPHNLVAANRHMDEVHTHMQHLDLLLHENLYNLYAF